MSDDRELTPLGRLLEHARDKVLSITGREAARRSGISESRWRQVVTGVQSAGGGATIRVNPSRVQVVQMALGVGVDAKTALSAAGHEVNPDQLRSLVEQAKRALPSADPPLRIDLWAEYERARDARESWETKFVIIGEVIKMYLSEERRAGPSSRTA